MKLKVSLYSQRDSQWGSILLGYNTSSQYTVYNYGCLITTLGNYVGKTPDEVNQILKDNGGFAAGSGNFIWGKSAALGISQTYVSPYYDDLVSSQAITKIKEYITGGLPLVCEVDFNPADVTKQQHFVLLAGIDDVGNILVVDPWEGQWETWSEEACKRNIYQFRAYDKPVSKDEQIEYVQVPKSQLDDFNRVKEGWNQIRTKLDVEDSVTVVVSEVEKLVGYEDAVVQKDKQLQETQNELAGVKMQLGIASDKNTSLVGQCNDLQGQVTEQTTTITTLKTKIDDLEKVIIVPTRKGWKAFIVDIIDKI